MGVDFALAFADDLAVGSPPVTTAISSITGSGFLFVPSSTERFFFLTAGTFVNVMPAFASAGVNSVTPRARRTAVCVVVSLTGLAEVAGAAESTGAGLDEALGAALVVAAGLAEALGLAAPLAALLAAGLGDAAGFPAAPIA